MNINRDSSCEYKPSTNLTSSSHWVAGRGDCTTTCVHHPGSPAKDSLILLPPKSAPLCYVDDKVSKVAWLNRSNIIYAGQDKWSLDPRVDLVTKGQLEYSLRIQKVDVYDEGSYTCSIQTKQQPKTSQVYLIVTESIASLSNCTQAANNSVTKLCY
ncbi:hypothetical protein NQZ68_031610 [Dissostichus eleginoides]|nr:hypothetical protein NQZ68_031610 [Dissostichus eleginoides]